MSGLKFHAVGFSKPELAEQRISRVGEPQL